MAIRFFHTFIHPSILAFDPTFFFFLLHRSESNYWSHSLWAARCERWVQCHTMLNANQVTPPRSPNWLPLFPFFYCCLQLSKRPASSNPLDMCCLRNALTPTALGWHRRPMYVSYRAVDWKLNESLVYYLETPTHLLPCSTTITYPRVSPPSRQTCHFSWRYFIKNALEFNSLWQYKYHKSKNLNHKATPHRTVNWFRSKLSPFESICKYESIWIAILWNMDIAINPFENGVWQQCSRRSSYSWSEETPIAFILSHHSSWSKLENLNPPFS